jgi:hypothetical protein
MALREPTMPIPLEGESTLRPSKIILTKTKKLHFFFWGTCGHHILDYLCSFQVCCIKFRLKLDYFKRNSNKHFQT